MLHNLIIHLCFSKHLFVMESCFCSYLVLYQELMLVLMLERLLIDPY